MNKELINEVKISENIWIGDFNNNPSIIIMDSRLKEIKKKVLQVKKIVINEKSATIIIMNSHQIREIILSILENSEINLDISPIIELFSDIPSSNYLKLRGDFTEAMFIYKNGGKKIIGDKKFDILLNENYVEVKSFSSSIGTVSIKNSQIVDNVKIVAAPIYMDNDGMNIIELAGLISDIEFKYELIERYEKTIASEFKFSIGEFHVLDPKKLELNSTIQDVTISYFVNEIIGARYE